MSYNNQSLVFPPINFTSSSYLEKLDPTAKRTLDFVKWSIDRKLLTPWVTMCSASNLTMSASLVNSMHVVPFHLLNLNKNVNFPILNFERISSNITNASNQILKKTDTCELTYVLPAMSIVNLSRFHPFLNALNSIIPMCLKLNNHPDYPVTTGSVCEYNGPYNMKSAFGTLNIAGDDKNFYPALKLTYETVSTIKFDANEYSSIPYEGSDGDTYLMNFDDSQDTGILLCAISGSVEG